MAFKELNIWHVYPLNDKKQHIIKTIEDYHGRIKSICGCNPRIGYHPANDSVIIIHNSYDGREGVEWATEILSVKK